MQFIEVFFQEISTAAFLVIRGPCGVSAVASKIVAYMALTQVRYDASQISDKFSVNLLVIAQCAWI